MDELTKIVLQTHTEALIQILYRLPNPPKSVAAKLYSALEKLGGRTTRPMPWLEPQKLSETTPPENELSDF